MAGPEPNCNFSFTHSVPTSVPGLIGKKPFGSRLLDFTNPKAKHAIREHQRAGAEAPLLCCDPPLWCLSFILKCVFLYFF